MRMFFLCWNLPIFFFYLNLPHPYQLRFPQQFVEEASASKSFFTDLEVTVELSGPAQHLESYKASYRTTRALHSRPNWKCTGQLSWTLCYICEIMIIFSILMQKLGSLYLRLSKKIRKWDGKDQISNTEILQQVEMMAFVPWSWKHSCEGLAMKWRCWKNLYHRSFSTVIWPLADKL